MAVVNPFTAGSGIPMEAEQATATAPLHPVIASDPSVRGRLMLRLQMMQQWWILEGGDGDCPDETDTDLVADNAIQ